MLNESEQSSFFHSNAETKESSNADVNELPTVSNNRSAMFRNYSETKERN